MKKIMQMPMAMGIMEKIYNGFDLKEPMCFFLFRLPNKKHANYWSNSLTHCNWSIKKYNLTA